jgi:antitoxin (DNA-binding transcriptional repressor) of toxin-antitoxin stability system
MADADPAIKQVGVRELRANLSALLREAQQGRSIQVVSRGEILAQIGPPQEPPPPPRRVPGLLKGKIWIADDFDELPEEILDAMINGDP